ncbi:putative very-long-chain enoyl-CoA reductase art-1 [Sesamum alatum]|uniref:Very-long-chain enoyl-CoA reductase art-1 n=1 Tax=Sesamum alatum TaxID=300844 RepID=A0AAE1YUG9_9LAMI|nr:putative very-long-chain enoyl-CoA reductase art-1 [Sesamum alatum]
MITKMLESLVYPDSSSAYVKAYYGFTVLAVAYLGIAEATGKHLQYSKFWNSSSGSNKSAQILIPSKVGMLILYTPALLAGVSSFWVFSDGDGIRFLMLKSAITIHFLKRDLEVLFVHKFSGHMVLNTALLISSTYFTAAASMIYFQNRVEGVPEPLVDLKYVGLLVFLVGMVGNFYHHYLLSKLRDEKDKGYKIPRGGLFSLVICPHYLFEILTFIGISFISQTLFSYLFTVGSAMYLLARSRATRNWYLSKFEDFPKNVKALIPYVL